MMQEPERRCYEGCRGPSSQRSVGACLSCECRMQGTARREVKRERDRQTDRGKEREREQEAAVAGECDGERREGWPTKA